MVRQWDSANGFVTDVSELIVSSAFSQWPVTTARAWAPYAGPMMKLTQLVQFAVVGVFVSIAPARILAQTPPVQRPPQSPTSSPPATPATPAAASPTTRPPVREGDRNGRAIFGM